MSGGPLAVLRTLEWSGVRRGQGSGPMGSGGDGRGYASCPACHGIKEPSREFTSDAIGHRPHCELAAALSASPAPSGQDVAGEVPTDAQVREAMQDAWDNFCDDAQAIPGDIRREGRKTFFVAGTWADHTAMNLRAIMQRDAAPASQPQGEVERLMHVIDRNRYTAAACVNAVEYILHTRRWLREAGRGSYACDDERYQQEFGLAFDEIMEALRPMRAVAQDKSDCTTDPEKVQAARASGAERFAALTPAATVEPHAPATGEVEPSWTGDLNKLASELRRVSKRFNPELLLAQILRDAADEIDCLTTQVAALSPQRLDATQQENDQ